jgi:para-nitrobenzyl esterase
MDTSAATEAHRPILKTMLGPVRGTVEDGVFTFRGVRYGAPPVGASRFKPSRRPSGWTEPVDASAYGASAIQMPMGLADTLEPSPLKTALSPILPPPEDKAHESEDCLFLNAWSPALGDGKNRAIMVWLHGGGYAAGSASWPVCDGARLAKDGDVVVVSINHRLNVFGFLFLADMAGMEYAQSGNAGTLDILLALLWVRDNAAALGGDRNNITIFGESGGGMKVCTLLAMRATRTYIHKAIVQSGPQLRCLSRERATATARAILAELGLSLPGDLKRLQEIPAHDLVAAALAARESAQGASRNGWLSPVMDNFAMAAHPFDPTAPALSMQIPLMIGHTKDEGTFFLLNDPRFGRFTDDDLQARAESIAPSRGKSLVGALRSARPKSSPSELMSDLVTAATMFAGSATIAERKAAQEAAVFAYRLDWETPVANGVLKSTHALDVPLVFDNVEQARSLVGGGATPQELAQTMSAAWVAFAKTGNPNVAQLPDWPRYEPERRSTMLIGEESRVAYDPDGEVRRILQA